MSALQPCDNCGTPDAPKRCAGCRRTCYCDRACQIEAWRGTRRHVSRCQMPTRDPCGMKICGVASCREPIVFGVRCRSPKENRYRVPESDTRFLVCGAAHKTWWPDVRRYDGVSMCGVDGCDALPIGGFTPATFTMRCTADHNTLYWPSKIVPACGTAECTGEGVRRGSSDVYLCDNCHDTAQTSMKTVAVAADPPPPKKTAAVDPDNNADSATQEEQDAALARALPAEGVMRRRHPECGVSGCGNAAQVRGSNEDGPVHLCDAHHTGASTPVLGMEANVEMGVNGNGCYAVEQ